MVFTTQVFLFYFLPLALLGYYLFPVRWRNLYLAVISYVFYGWWKPWFASLMFTSSLIDWFAGAMITAPGATPAKRKAGLWFSIVANLTLLGFFKYFMFAQQNVNWLLAAFGRQPLPLLQIVLPVGISFYTFQTMSYSFDLYRGHAQRAKSFIDFMCFVALFPQLVAGPIVRYQQIADQLVLRPQRGELFCDGVFLFMVGFAKKILLANTVSEVVDIALHRADAVGPLTIWWGLSAWSFQAYFDFSGYSDMANGLGRMFGFTFLDNFRSPYKAQSGTMFWQRWHISLSYWLRDYVYIPLGGSHGSTLRTVFNLMVTFGLSGLWHGATWNFVLFGLYQGALVSLERLTKTRCLWSFLPAPLRVLAFNVVYLFSWTFFCYDDLHGTAHCLTAMFAGVGSPEAQAVAQAWVFQPFYVVAMLCCFGITFFGIEAKPLLEKARANGWIAVLLAVLFAWSVIALFAQAENPFIYFRF